MCSRHLATGKRLLLVSGQRTLKTAETGSNNGYDIPSLTCVMTVVSPSNVVEAYLSRWMPLLLLAGRPGSRAVGGAAATGGGGGGGAANAFSSACKLGGAGRRLLGPVSAPAAAAAAVGMVGAGTEAMPHGGSVLHGAGSLESAAWSPPERSAKGEPVVVVVVVAVSSSSSSHSLPACGGISGSCAGC